MEYTVLGDTVNVAARLQDKAVAGPKLVGEDTYTKARRAGRPPGDEGADRAAGEGTEKPLKVYDVVREMRA